MFAEQDMSVIIIFLLVFLATCCAGCLLFLRSYGDKRIAIDRLRDLSKSEEQLERSPNPVRYLGAALPKLGSHLLPSHENRLLSLKEKFLKAGFFGESSLRVFMGVKLLLLTILPILFAVIPYVLGWLDLKWALVASIHASAAGMFMPNIWLHNRIKRRQSRLRRGLPDALDMLVLCVEGGLTFSAALMRVTQEMIIVHPTLAVELRIIEREIHLGTSPGEALKRFADRCGIDEVRDLASVLIQSERYGASMVKALKTHADSYREERQQQLEETAQKAAVMILFPTLLCIFPAIFIVVLGPAAFQMAELFAK